jgi:hypothetical protein
MPTHLPPGRSARGRACGRLLLAAALLLACDGSVLDPPPEQEPPPVQPPPPPPPPPPATDPVRLSFIIAGQSNASGRGLLVDAEAPDTLVQMFGNDYVLKTAYEPVDDSTDQVDAVSADPHTPETGGGHGFALRAAKGVLAGQSRTVLLVPCAKGGTTISQWMPRTNRLSRSTLYGSCNYRRAAALADSVPTAIWYYGHESNVSRIDSYAAEWSELVAEFRQDYGEAVPFIYAQLARHTGSNTSAAQARIAEIQRRQETGSGAAESLPGQYMVVTFDLPLGDPIHLNTEALKVLGDRVALATRQHVLGEAVNGTGPRLRGVAFADAGRTAIDVLWSVPVNAAVADYDDQFRVFVDGERVYPTAIERLATDERTIRITLPAPATGAAEVSYGQTRAAGTGIRLHNVVRDGDGLPAPSFGPVPVVDAGG